MSQIHPGEILLEEFLKPYGLSPYKAAKLMNVPRTRVERLVAEDTPVTVDTALRLSRLFGTTPEFWMNLQARYDLTTTRPGPDVEAIAPLQAVA